MPLPRWLARINRRVFNPRALDRENWPILTHVGRVSGRVRRTPIDAYPIDGGVLFQVNYGADTSDWVRNVLQAGEASVRIDGRDIALTNPRIISMDEAMSLGAERLKQQPRFMNITECLRMDRA
jgi:deazaflavin-dependent oxidoreductase (nitroreductase family)